MLSKKVANAAAIALVACFASGLIRAAVAVAQFYRPSDPWLPWIELFAFAAYIVGIGAAMFAYTNAPAKPPEWHPAKPWGFDRLAPAAVYAGFMILTLAMYKSTGAETSELFWKLGIGTSGQFAFALLVWEHRWSWRTFTPSQGAPAN